MIRLGYDIGGGVTNFAAAAPPPRHYVSDLPAWKTPFPTEAEVKSDYGGAGHIERYLTLFYARVPFSHLADLEGKAQPLAGADKIEQENLTYFLTPFDIRGTASSYGAISRTPIKATRTEPTMPGLTSPICAACAEFRPR